MQINPEAHFASAERQHGRRAHVALSQANVEPARLAASRARATHFSHHRHQRPDSDRSRSQVSKQLILTQKGNTPLRLDAFGQAVEGVENNEQAGWAGTNRAVLVIIQKQADANVIETVDRIRAVLPQLERWMPPGIKLSVLSDRTTTIRAAVHDVEMSLLISIALVVMVVFVFLRRFWPTFIANVTVPLALSGTVGAMYLFGTTALIICR